MKHIFLLGTLSCWCVSAMAQEVVIDTNYYTPPPVRRRVLTADPDQQTEPRGRLKKLKNDWMDQFSEQHTWYAALEGALRTEGSVSSNSFNGLISNPGQSSFTWGLLLGYTYRNAWAAELGYSYAPIHLNITVVNTPTPYAYHYQNSGHGIPLRLKRRLGSADRAQSGTGFWVSAGAWLLPNGQSLVDALHFTGRSAYSRRSPVDTLQLSINTETTTRMTGLAELGLDYAVRLSSTLELAFTARKFWGLGKTLHSDLVYSVNSTAETRGTITANGAGWGFGGSLRYIYSRQHALKKRVVSGL